MAKLLAVAIFGLSLATDPAVAADFEPRNDANIQKFLQLQFPKRINEMVGNTLKDCEEPAYHNHPIKVDRSGKILAQCLPDTLYSWGSMDKIRWLEREMGKGQWNVARFRGYIATVANPTGSFGYGDYAIRIKLKKSVQFIQSIHKGQPGRKNVVTCGALTTQQKKTSVIVISAETGPWRSGLEFILCSPGPIESWSYGTPEFYDEMVKDVRWILDPANKGNYQTYYRIYEPSAGRYEPAFLGFEIDMNHTNFSAERLAGNFEKQLELVQKHSEMIYFNSDLKPSLDQPAQSHFWSKWTIYFHDLQPD